MIASVAGKCEYSQNKATDKARAPGMKYAHYMPSCETALFKRNEYEKAQKLYDELISLGKRPYFMCDDEMAKKVSGNILPLGKTAKDIASNLYFRLLEGEKNADCIISFDVETGDELDIGIMNRLTKACRRIE